MPQSRYPTPEAENPDLQRSSIVIDGQTYDNRISLTSDYHLAIGYANLQSKKICPPISVGTNQNKALAILNAVGCTVEVGNPSLSLLSLETDTTVITNQSIFDATGFSEIRNEEVSPTQQFIDTSDPFWELDDAPPRTIQDRNAALKEQVDVTRLAGDLAKYNIQGKRKKYSYRI